MDNQSPSQMVKQLEAQINHTLRKIDFRKISAKERNTLQNLQQNLVDARIYLNGYELSETRDEQLDNAKQAKHWLDRVGENVLLASEFDIFGAIDVAHLSAQIEQIISNLK